MTIKIKAIMATYNRVEKTVACIAAANASAIEAGVDFQIIVADASSTDGTRSRLESAFDNVDCITVPANKYWASSMRVAWETACARDYDFLLWLNDDVMLTRSAFADLLVTVEAVPVTAVVVGPCTNADGTRVTYSGLSSGSRWNHLSMRPVFDPNEPVSCDTFNGNVVLIPREVDGRVGGFPDRYTHSMADLHYGFSLRRHGIPAYVAPHCVGVCDRNEVAGTWQDTTLPPKTRIKLLKSPKGLPFREWTGLALRFGGPLGPAASIKPYAHLYLLSALAQIKSVFGKKQTKEKGNAGHITSTDSGRA